MKLRLVTALAIAAMAGTYKYLAHDDEIILELQVSNDVVLTERFTRM